ncbi:MAG TPA: hypothetical protein VFA79_17305 [Myxococcales bacterium]|nr:hypothetical protein [Myxococcales bacterium]
MASDRELSEIPPDQFVAARNALAEKLRERGETEEARRVAALRRPSTPLWIVNQLGRRAPAALEKLIDATQRARRAQVHAGARDELRDAMQAQRQALHELLADAGKIAAGIGTRITPEIQRRIQDTVQTAATSDPKALREGVLDQELSAAGFGALLGAAVSAHPGTAAVAAKAASQRSAFHERAAEQKRKVAEKREELKREREIQHAKQDAHRLASRAAQFERVAAQAREAAEKARARAEQARTVAEAAAARLLGLRR